MGVQGYIMQLQPFSVNDGDGIRTTIFMAGCPLRCRWCANPEGLTMYPKIGWYQRKCIGCGVCAAACPQGIGIDLNAERDKCINCGACAAACPADARSMLVTLMDAEDILRQIQRHRLFYAYSGGGITFSGGEATAQPEFFEYLTERIYDMGYSMDLETCGLFDWDRAEPALRRMDLIFMDLKLMDPDRHLQWTGVSNEKILENMKRLATLRSSSENDSAANNVGADSTAGAVEAVGSANAFGGPEIVIRIPVIGGVNDDDDNIRASAAFVHRYLPHARMELLPYHRLGAIKYEALGISYDHPEFTTPDKAEMERLRELVRAEGVELADFR